MMLPVKKLKEGMVIAADVYAQESSTIPILAENQVLTRRMIAGLQEKGIQMVSVFDNAKTFSFPSPIPKLPVISYELRKNAVNSLEEFFRIARIGQEEKQYTTAVHAVKQLDIVVDQLVDCLTQDGEALVNVVDLKSYDEYTYHHSLSVAVLTISIANTLGFSRKSLTLAGRSAILHDIGKIAIPIDVIQKPGRLSEKELALIRTHSTEGYKFLSKGNIGDYTLWQNVLCHHEKLNGSGYPMGFKKNEIPIVSRIISIADVYDALTSNRPYRHPMEPQDALEYIMANVGEAFDDDLVECVVKKLELYPVGSFVRLSNGKYAIVVNNEYSMWPVVKLIDTEEELDLFRDRQYLNLTIVQTLQREEILQQYAN